MGWLTRGYNNGRSSRQDQNPVLPLQDRHPVKHKLVVKGLGFTRLNQIVEREDTPSIRGMVLTVPHLVRIVQ